MAGATAALPLRPARAAPRRDPLVVRCGLIALALAALGVLIVLPLVAVFVQAFQKGAAVYFAAIRQPDTLAAIRLSLLTAAIVVPLNTLFGLAAAWTVTKFEFRGRNVLLALIDLPLAVSPVIAGLIYVLVFGAQGWLAPWLPACDPPVIFAVPGIVLATTFLTLPFIQIGRA